MKRLPYCWQLWNWSCYSVTSEILYIFYLLLHHRSMTSESPKHHQSIAKASPKHHRDITEASRSQWFSFMMQIVWCGCLRSRRPNIAAAKNRVHLISFERKLNIDFEKPEMKKEFFISASLLNNKHFLNGKIFLFNALYRHRSESVLRIALRSSRLNPADRR